MNYRLLYAILGSLILFSGVILASEPPLDYTFCWSPGPLEAEDGTPLAPAAAYEVWLQEDAGEAYLAATVEGDTTYVLQPEFEVVYRVRVCGIDAEGRCSTPSEWSDPIQAFLTTDAPDAQNAALRPAQPNPFNPLTTLAYAVPADGAPAGRVRLQIFDVRGKLIRDLETEAAPGWHEARWNGTDNAGRQVATGTYLALYACGETVRTTKLSLVK
jgi:hypothetical protein